MSNGPVLVGPCHVYIPKAFRWKGYPSFFAISLNVHADVGVGMQEGWQILGVYSQFEFAVFSEIPVPLGDDVCMCGKCDSLVG